MEMIDMYNIYGFGKRISSYRKMLGFTQEELAITS
jgi:DNA-binding XRE family transcriptional regulator